MPMFRMRSMGIFVATMEVFRGFGPAARSQDAPKREARGPEAEFRAP